MPYYAVWHGECDNEADAKVVTAKDVKAALDAVDPVFRYQAGDVDCWKDVESHKKHVKVRVGLPPPKLMKPGSLETRIALVDDSDDYFLVCERAAL